MTPKVITGPVTEPLTVAEAKTHLRVDSSDEDALILSYITAAREYLEWRTGRTFISQTLEIVLDEFPSASDTAISLPRATPLTSVTHVKYTDDTGAETTWSSSEYVLDTDNNPGSIKPDTDYTWPSFTAYPINPIRIRYVAGDNSSPIVVADNVRAAMYLLVERYYDHRSNLTDRRFVKGELGYGIEALIAQLQVEYAF